jgi:hypothetical protein
VLTSTMASLVGVRSRHTWKVQPVSSSPQRSTQ